MDLNRFDKCWFALQVRPRYEFVTSRILRNKGFEEFLPTYKSKREWSDRKKEIELPLFPGYVFCRFNAGIHVPILSTPGVVRIVGSNAVIPDSEIEAIQRVVVHRLPSHPCAYLKVGTKVEVIAGPLLGVQGILVSYSNHYRLILSVNLVQNSISVEVEHGDVIPARTNDSQLAPVAPRPIAPEAPMLNSRGATS